MVSTNVPILLIVFNRPDHTHKMIDQLRKVKPKHLFVAADGPRTNKNEEHKTNSVRSIINNNIDWNCTIKTRFLDQNIGCGLAPATAISWFFEYVEYGVILEDDCLPDPSFFPFCEELLEKYKDNANITEIQSSYHLGIIAPDSPSYSFSRISGTWGWATWKRAWDLFDYNMTTFPKLKEEQLKNVFKHSFIAKQLTKKYRDGYTKKYNDVWDCQWQFAQFMNNGLSIVPHKQLVKNFGFGDDATHCFEEHKIYKNIEIENIVFPLQHPAYIIPDIKTDISFYKNWRKLNKETNLNKIRRHTPNSIRRIIRKIRQSLSF